MTAPNPAATILYVDHTAKIGGGEIALCNLIDALDRRLFRPVAALAEDGPLVARLEEIGCKVVVIPLDKRLAETRKESLGSSSLLQRVRQVAGSLGYSLRLAKLARGEQVQIIHANSLKSDIFGGVAGRLAGIPVIWHVRDHIDGEYLPRRAALAFRWLAGWLPRVAVAISRSVLRELTAGQGVAPEAISPDAVAKNAMGSRVARYQIVYDGCRMHEFAGGYKPPHDSGASVVPVVSLVGRIAPWKGQHVFINAAAELFRRGIVARYRIVGAPLFGEDEYKEKLHRQAAELGIEDAVEFLGFRADVPELIAGSAVIVHASTLAEPFGQVVIEAMAAGKPVIATDGGAIPEIVVPNVTGVIVPRGDSRQLAGAIAGLLSDPGKRARMGLAGRERVVSRFDVALTARKVEALYAALLEEGRGPAETGVR